MKERKSERNLNRERGEGERSENGRYNVRETDRETDRQRYRLRDKEAEAEDIETDTDRQIVPVADPGGASSGAPRIPPPVGENKSYTIGAPSYLIILDSSLSERIKGGERKSPR